MKRDRHHQLWETYKRLIALRKQNRALQTANIQFFYEHEGDRVFAYERWHDHGSRVIIVANFSDAPRDDYPISNIPCNGVWCECLKNSKIESKNNQLLLNLSSYEAQVWVLELE